MKMRKLILKEGFFEGIKLSNAGNLKCIEEKVFEWMYDLFQSGISVDKFVDILYETELQDLNLCLLAVTDNRFVLEDQDLLNFYALNFDGNSFVIESSKGAFSKKTYYKIQKTRKHGVVKSEIYKEEISRFADALSVADPVKEVSLCVRKNYIDITLEIGKFKVIVAYPKEIATVDLNDQVVEYLINCDPNFYDMWNIFHQIWVIFKKNMDSLNLSIESFEERKLLSSIQIEKGEIVRYDETSGVRKFKAV